MFVLIKSCFICLSNKQELNFLFDVDDNGINYHDKLTSSFTDMCFRELDKQTMICTQCCQTLDIVYKFWQRCVKSTNILKDHIAQLNLGKTDKNYNIYISDTRPNQPNIAQNLNVPPLAPLASKTNKIDIKSTNVDHNFKDLPPLAILQKPNIPPLSDIAQRANKIIQPTVLPRLTKIAQRKVPAQNSRVAQKSDIAQNQNEMPPLKRIKLRYRASKTISTAYSTISPKHPTILRPVRNSISKQVTKSAMSTRVAKEDIAQDQVKEEFLKGDEYDLVIAYDDKSGSKNDIDGEGLGLSRIEEVDVKPNQNSLNLKDENDKETIVEIDAEKLYYIVEEKGNVVYLKSEDEIKNDSSTRKRKLFSTTEISNPIEASNPLVCAPKRERGLYECTICQAQLRGKKTLLRHLESHGENTHECTICVQHFPDDVTLKEHMKMHTEACKPYECDICDRTFLELKSYHEHLRLHSGDKPLYECNICQARYKQRAAINRHVKKHEKTFIDQKLYECNICKQMYNHRNAFDVHMDLHWRKVI